MTILTKSESSSKRNTLQTYLRIFREFVHGPERRRLTIAIIALIISSSSNLAFPTIMGKAIDLSTTNKSYSRFRLLAIIVASTFGVGALASFLRVYSFKITAHRIEQRMRKRLYQSILNQEFEFFSNEKLGELNSRMLNDVSIASKSITDNVAQCLRGLNSAVGNLSSLKLLIGGISMLLLLSPKLTCVTVALIPFLGVSSIFYNRKARNLVKRLDEATAIVTAQGEERIACIETVRIFGREEQESKQFSTKLNHLYPCARQAAAMEGFMMSFISIAVNSSLLAVLWFGGVLVRNGSMSVGNLTSFALYSSMVGLGCSALSKVYTDIVKASIAADRVFEILDRPYESINEGEYLPKVSGELVFEDVNFSYKSREKSPILNKFSMKILPGQVVALAGHSGSGKTTVSRLLTSLIKPTKGSIRLDGIEIAKLNPTWLRSSVFGVVSQEPVLFDLTIADNICYGKPDANDTEIQLAAKQANAHEFIMRLPQNYNTRVGERGVQLSAGQRQRIAIARAILKNPPCLLLDEATSALDCESESQVQQALERLMQGRTTLMIAHRASTLSYSHRVDVMKDGKIIESGTFLELKTKKDGFFASLIKTGIKEI